MPGVLHTFDKGPLTFSANVNILGGMVVEPDGTTGRIKPATAASTKCIGVALGDAAAYNYAPADSTDAWGNSIANMNPFPPNETAVAFQGVMKLKAAGAIAFGDLVIAAANGEVATIGAGTFAQVIGRCVEPGGIASGARGKINLSMAGA